MPGTTVKDVTENDVKTIKEFISKTVNDSGSNGVVIGLSGGIDSAVVAKLCVDVLGSDKVHTIFMPSSTTPEDDLRCTDAFAEQLGTKHFIIPVAPAVDAIIAATGAEGTLRKGNISARCRMTVLFDHAGANRMLVMGTSNKSELMMGYFTKFGDGASDALPLAGLYKTQVKQLARLISVPEEFITKAPSAGLWEGQTDEAEMGITYELLDRLLEGSANGLPSDKISAKIGIPMDEVERILKRVASMEHKRRPAPRP